MKYSIMSKDMKTQNNEEYGKKKRNSVLLFIAFVLTAGVAGLFFGNQIKENGAVAVVTVNGEEQYRCSMFIEKEIEINDTNTLLIKGGKADMIVADCPDQVCVKHTPVSKVGETIICLPNKVVITIESLDGNQKQKEGEPDAVAK